MTHTFQDSGFLLALCVALLFTAAAGAQEEPADGPPEDVSADVAEDADDAVEPAVERSPAVRSALALPREDYASREAHDAAPVVPGQPG